MAHSCICVLLKFNVIIFWWPGLRIALEGRRNKEQKNLFNCITFSELIESDLFTTSGQADMKKHVDRMFFKIFNAKLVRTDRTLECVCVVVSFLERSGVLYHVKVG